MDGGKARPGGGGFLPCSQNLFILPVPLDAELYFNHSYFSHIRPGSVLSPLCKLSHLVPIIAQENLLGVMWPPG